MNYLRALRLFCKIVFREVEEKGCGIPDPYRTKDRISPRLAWDIVRIVWGKER